MTWNIFAEINIMHMYKTSIGSSKGYFLQTIIVTSKFAAAVQLNFNHGNVFTHLTFYLFPQIYCFYWRQNLNVEFSHQSWS